MALMKIRFAPGINKAITSLAGKGGWHDCDKVRFRFGYPEKIGGWIPLSTNAFLGIARTLHNWVTLANENLLGVGTHLKYYIERGGAYNDVTPVRMEDTIPVAAFLTVTDSSIVTVNDPAHGAVTGDFVTIITSDDVGGIPAEKLSGNFQLKVVDADNYNIDVGVLATDTAIGGSAEVVYEIPTGGAVYSLGTGWGAGPWGGGTVTGWGQAAESGIGVQLRIWNHANFGEWLIFGPRGGGLYIWKPDANPNIFNRGTPLGDEAGASDVPILHNFVLVSDVSRFVICFGVNDYGQDEIDPMLIRWSDQESIVNWSPSVVNQASFQRLSKGSYIVAAKQTRQEILIWTDTALYSMQYLGPPYVWGINLIADNTSIISPNAITITDDAVFWMGKGNFYAYDGRANTMPCTLRKYVFQGMNQDQAYQIISGSNQDYNEVWWFYCSTKSTDVDRYVIYNTADNIWYHGSMRRTAWLDSPLRQSPMGVVDGKTYFHEQGTDNGETNPPSAIVSHIQSSAMDINDGDKYGFIWRVVPDITFNGSTINNPVAFMNLTPRQNPGAKTGVVVGENIQSEQPHDGFQVYLVEEFTQYVYARCRGRVVFVRVGSDTLGTQWQLGDLRLDLREDGKRQ